MHTMFSQPNRKWFIGCFTSLLLVATLHWEDAMNVALANIGAVKAVQSAFGHSDSERIMAARSALSLYRQIDEQKKDATDYRYISQAFLSLQEYNLSIAALINSIRLSPDISTYYLLGNVHFEAGNRIAAVEAWRHAQAAPYFVQLGNRSKVVGERKQYYEIAIDIAPDVAEFYYTYADFLYYNTAEREQAIQLYETAVRLDGAARVTSDKYTALAHIAQHKFDWLNALQNYSQVIALGDHSANTYMEYGDALDASGGDFDLIREAYQNAQTMEPLNQWPYLRMTNFYIKNNQLPQLVDWYTVTLNILLTKSEYKHNQLADFFRTLAQANADMGACAVYQLLVQMDQKLDTQSASQSLSVIKCE